MRKERKIVLFDCEKEIIEILNSCLEKNLTVNITYAEDSKSRECQITGKIRSIKRINGENSQYYCNLLTPNNQFICCRLTGIRKIEQILEENGFRHSQ